jgi:hypothetical protein
MWRMVRDESDWGQAGKRKVTEFTAGAVIPRIEQLYRSLLADGAVRSEEWTSEILPNESVPLPPSPNSYPIE